MPRVEIVMAAHAPRAIQEQMEDFVTQYPSDIGLQRPGRESVGPFAPETKVVVVMAGDGRNQDVRRQLEQHRQESGTVAVHVAGVGGSEMGFRKTLIKSGKKGSIVTMEDLLEGRTATIPLLHAGEIAGQPFTVNAGVGKIAEGVARLDSLYRGRVPRKMKRAVTMIHAYLKAVASGDDMDPATELYFIAQQVDPLAAFKEQNLYDTNLVTKLSIEGEGKCERALKLGLFFTSRLFHLGTADSLATVTTLPQHEVANLGKIYTKVNVDGEEKEIGEAEPVIKRSALALPTAALVWEKNTVYI